MSKRIIECIKNKQKIQSSEICGCFFCLELFAKEEIVEWADGGETAICPRCHKEFVLTNIDSDELKQIHDACFKTS